MKYINLNSAGFADVSGFIKCYLINQDGEFIGERDEYIPATTGLPAHAFIEPVPTAEDGKAIVRNNGLWVLIDDYRGKNVYSTESGEKSVIDYIGPVHVGFTLLAPVTQYDKWNGEEWVTDSEALKFGLVTSAEQRRQSLISEANGLTADWRTELVLGIIDSDDKAKLAAWMKYIKEVKAVDISAAPDINWPDKPEK